MLNCELLAYFDVAAVAAVNIVVKSDANSTGASAGGQVSLAAGTNTDLTR